MNKQIVDAITEFLKLSPERGERPWPGNMSAYANALAEHLAAVLPVTVDELVEKAVKLLVPAGQNRMPYIRIFCDGSGSVREDREDVRAEATLAHWLPTDNPSKTAIKAIKAAMKPEPTDREKALEVCDQIVESLSLVGPVGDIYKGIEIIRKALEAE